MCWIGQISNRWIVHFIWQEIQTFLVDFLSEYRAEFPADVQHMIDDMSIFNFKIGIEGEKILKQVRGQKQVREWKQVKNGAKGSLYVE